MNERFIGKGLGGIRKKILIVDDSALILHVAQTFLAGWYDVIAAGSADEAHDKAVAERPDLVLMDFDMPHRNGLEALMELRRDPRTKDIPVVLMAKESERSLLPAGLDSLIKPFEATTLLNTLRTHLGGRASLYERKTA